MVLPYIIHKNSLIMSCFCYHISHLAHQQRTFRRMNVLLDDLLLFLLTIFLKRITPLTMNILVQQASDGRERLLAVANHSHISLDDFIYLSLIYIEVDNLSLLSILRRYTCNTVAESHTNGYQHITLLCLHIGSIRAMHTEHTHV